ncbi:hypothetical protein P6F26_19100 [Roseibacterium sp. SDUM158017]|uniref:hypothetical protein n=1 Tax=Roseicyclus salinarum TaxID=3036773 RepID=UPI002415428E|nr:hypothetical protein [Roseibacterium sp. SDUM158017]MDG4650555.1 hypothetical protein [Roseibacterium sp. SDUM158017]
MKGSIYAPLAARLRDRSGTRLYSLDTVIATVAVSSVVSALASFVVVSNVYEAIHGKPGAAVVYRTATADEAVQAPARRLPVVEQASGLGILSRFPDQGPSSRQPARPDDIGVTFAALPHISQPLGRDASAEIAVAPPSGPLPARRAGPEIAFDLRTPLARPDGVGPRATPEAETAASAALVSVSPRPANRPGTIVAMAARRQDAARAEAPEAALAPARLGAGPDRGGLVQPRAGRNPCSARMARGIPRRPGSAAGGSAVMASLGNGSGSGRDNAIVNEALRGNVPDYLRGLQPVRFTGTVGGRQTEVVVCVTPDYLAVGSDRDHVRVPLGLPAALRVADAFDMMLPTTRMVDAIYAQAQLRMAPRPMSPGPQMSSTDYFLRHDATLDAQFADAGGRQGLLVAGHKKDLVIANRLSSNRGRVAIYGWHRGNGDPIQPLSTVHGEYYADYSHGIRLVSRTAYLDGRAVDLRALLTDGGYAGLLNNDGPLSSATIQLASL